ncbi:glucose-1-phosphate adenylyltransferase subunit GlgD [Oceanotoga sp. DSM 15011]|jgi:glucose-1-phosphate adenylyltransferase|uniref:Glucose-1-phosphate adenylyltransferase n=1 Tax=Oceanotoga teriensis TaxID=515440 RepID=A0AA45HJZ4_9BACT|nr:MULTISPECIES: glucose-1-phosphate adenylyltransferase subunit GlgD [Oceanotoga]MDN5342908.1 glucose-phosphate adenylyltransferase [Oceanotoga sp.]MDO7975374.1 glucose-1-phosphate adenylyltransferase subunit GlgD [Oceanotoga teriensis]PWJ96706.1 glucose-1-phosphate adenylyltransferase [Oceanotoga teriensis]UYP00122.1 glucose-1-phosphate adenylyltransferase subunit GlgD [Oceanotoga sp. DSM 15011]
MKVLGLILSGSSGNKLEKLTKKRTSAAVPVFGKYRAIDFTLSNMVNSGINKVGVLTQYNPRSLMDHLGSGKEWNLDRKRGGMFILQPFLSSFNDSMFYEGTADAIFQNMTLLKRAEEDFVLIGSGDHIYNIDFKKLYKFHIRNGADITLITKEHKESYDIAEYGQIKVNKENKIIDIKEKIDEKISDKIFTGVYFINKALLMELLYSSPKDKRNDLLMDIIVPNLKRLRVYSYNFEGYWRNIKKSVKEYYDTNMDILNYEVRKELFYSGRKIYTKLKDFAPPKININAEVSNSFIADGCIINGIVKNSILSRGVIVKAGAVIENSIVLQDTIIEEGSHIKDIIIDKDVKIREGKTIESIKSNINIIEKGTVI